VIRDGQRERMFAKYVKVRKLLEVYERGLVEWNAETNRFEKVVTFDFAAPLFPFGHSLSQTVDDRQYVYFGNPYPLVRVPATAEALADPAQYEAFTCLTAGSTLEKAKVERTPDGAARYAWKRNTPVPTPSEQAKWLRGGQLKPGEAILALRDVDTGKTVQAHSGSVAWNAYRKCYVMIVEEAGGTSYLGESWYAEADTPVGPWVYARKIVTHEKYSFYNLRHHPMFDQEGGRRIFFEGTYTTFFSGNDDPTPRYDYNQVMYALDLADPRLVLPVPIYEHTADAVQTLGRSRQGRAAFMAPDRAREGLVGVTRANAATGELAIGASSEALFYALPPDAKKPPATTIALYEWRKEGAADAPRFYAIEGRRGPDGYTRAKSPLCRVWRYPLAIELDGQ
jgi:hypothetical protein